MVPLLTTEMFSRALWADRTAVPRFCAKTRAVRVWGGALRAGAAVAQALLLLWEHRQDTQAGALWAAVMHRDIVASVCAIESLARGHLTSFTGCINCSRRFLWHFHVCLLFRLLCSVPHFSWEQISPLSLLILQKKKKKKDHFYIICFLYFLFSTRGSCFAGPLLCKSPFTEEDLPVSDWQEVPGAGYETFETCELANQQVPVCSSGYAPSISS